MRWLIDEMLPAGVADQLIDAGQDARAVVTDLRGLTDDQLFDVAVAEGRAIVIENVVDFVAILERRLAAGLETAAVLFVRKTSLPAEPARLSRSFAERLTAWARTHPEPVATSQLGSTPIPEHARTE